METIAERYRKMSMADKEAELVCDDVEAEEDSSEVERPIFHVVGALITDRKINFPAFRETMASIWRPGRGVEIKKIEEKRYIFNFNHPVDVNRVIDGGLICVLEHCINVEVETSMKRGTTLKKRELDIGWVFSMRSYLIFVLSVESSGTLRNSVRLCMRKA
ncbi:unnamed protein product [Cuscuta epithymum]|uniref:DUF4283 domain-containing protein n=1 Tax=Cuscuta epithymum TaxID=186058 RepID=A0AAV0DRH0_9ASTE|nr:unnamed protein product [Cuscuta epithymum]